MIAGFAVSWSTEFGKVHYQSLYVSLCSPWSGPASRCSSGLMAGRARETVPAGWPSAGIHVTVKMAGPVKELCRSMTSRPMDSRERSRRLADTGFGWMAGDSPAPARRLRARRALAAERRFLQPTEPRQSPPCERWRLHVRGKVQGVGYRASCSRRATELGISGWVRNLADGSVEVEAEGQPQCLAELMLWCEKDRKSTRLNSSHSSVSRMPSSA